MKRYTWEDSLIEAQTKGLISNGALMVALKLAKAINWKPRKGRVEPGLYWKNEEAFKAVGLGRSTYYTHREALFDLGFFVEVRGNLIPRLPDSLPETAESSAETSKSSRGTKKSTGEQSFSEDTLPVDTYSVDSLSESSNR